MAAEITLESLGISQDALVEKLVDRIAGNILTSIDYDEDGGEWKGESVVATKLNAMVRARLDQVVVDLGEKYVLPRVGQMVEAMVLQETNRWGEKTGKPVTFTEYLVQRAEQFMVEPVNFDGKPKGTDPYNWSAKGTRVSHMIHQHLDYEIGTAMKAALKDATTSIAKGLHEAVRIQINDVAAKLKVDVKTA